MNTPGIPTRFVLLKISAAHGVHRAHLVTATNGDIEWRSAGLRPGASGSGSHKGAGPEAGAPVAVSGCARVRIARPIGIDGATSLGEPAIREPAIFACERRTIAQLWTARVYPDRTPGGDCHHCHSGGAAFASLVESKAEGHCDSLHEQPETIAVGVDDVFRRQR